MKKLMLVALLATLPAVCAAIDAVTPVKYGSCKSSCGKGRCGKSCNSCGSRSCNGNCH